MSTLTEIKKLPIFKLSLGSKELFHSNFLEFLWEYDRNSFIKMINVLLKSYNKSITLESTSNLRREKEHFDLCIFHKAKNGRIIYDLVLENKVKSLPDKGQLERYFKDIKKNKKAGSKTIFVLLSLAKDFPNKKEIENNWIVVNYKDLADAIQATSWPKKTGDSYIFDYKEFIEKLDALGDDILNNLNNEYLFQCIERYKEERLHDLYYKLRCAQFLALLKDELEKDPRIKGKLPVVFTEHNQIRKQGKPGFFLNVNIFRGVGQAAVFLYNGNGIGPGMGDIYEIVIQGDQYRHGINQDKEMDPIARWNILSQSGFSQLFLTNILGGNPSLGRGQLCNHYGKNYVYKYRKMVTEVIAPQSSKKKRKQNSPSSLLDLKVCDLLTKMVDDVLSTAESLRIIPSKP